MIPRMLAENSGTKSAATVLTELSAAHKEDNGKCIGYNIDAEQSLSTDIVSSQLYYIIFHIFISISEMVL
jgi:chaperonin GroEL (HSP60 family)